VKLQTPIKYRVNGGDAYLDELKTPEVITVKMMRSVSDLQNQFKAPIEICAAVAELTSMQKSNLELPDAIQYVTELSELGLLTANENSTFEIPVIKPVLATINRVTADAKAAYDFCAQVLIASGASEAKINAMDVRDFMPHMPDIVAVFTTGKKAQT
jgi:hypothetical protein